MSVTPAELAIAMARFDRRCRPVGVMNRIEAQLAAAREHVHRSTGQRVRWAKVWIAALAAAAQERIRAL